MIEPITAITSVLTSIRTATQIARTIRNANKKLEIAEYKSKLAELIESLADAKLTISQIKKVLAEKDEQLISLTQLLDDKSKMIYAHALYWKKDGNEKDGPFCPQCWDNSKKQIRLRDYGKDSWYCQTCKNTSEYK